MKFKYLSSLLVFAVLSGTAWAKLTVDEIVELHEQGVPEKTIVLAVKGDGGPFPTDAATIVELNKKGIPNSVLNAMLEVSASDGADSGESDEEVETQHPETVLLHAGGEVEEMSYLMPQNRTKARALGFGGVVTYAVLTGSAAKTRISEKTPSFVVSVPRNASAESYVSLASVEPRKNNSREVVIGGGYMSYSTGIIPDRVVEIGIVELEDQAKATENFTLYKVTPAQPLLGGEYALVLATGQSATFGYFGGSSNSSSWFDFGVE